MEKFSSLIRDLDVSGISGIPSPVTYLWLRVFISNKLLPSQAISRYLIARAGFCDVPNKSAYFRLRNAAEIILQLLYRSAHGLLQFCSSFWTNLLLNGFDWWYSGQELNNIVVALSGSEVFGSKVDFLMSVSARAKQEVERWSCCCFDRP